MKPSSKSQGKGIFLINKLSQVGGWGRGSCIGDAWAALEPAGPMRAKPCNAAQQRDQVGGVGACQFVDVRPHACTQVQEL
jgi:hypothetical protein